VCLHATSTSPPIMVNSCTGKMGHATAEAVLRAGLELIPYTFCGTSQGVAVGSVGVSGIPVERVSPDKRDQVFFCLYTGYQQSAAQ
jgi:4-hydroxy-tetrahydrodipicolinate reductase